MMFIVSNHNAFLAHVSRHQQWYLSALIFCIIAISLTTQSLLGKPLLAGEESYYHLTQAEASGLEGIRYLPLRALTAILPFSGLAFISPLLVITSLFLARILLRRFRVSEHFSLFSLLFFVLTPTFIYNVGILSGAVYWTFLVLLGFVLLSSPHPTAQKWASIPFFLATTVDIFSSFLLLTLLFIYYFHKNLTHKNHPKSIRHILFPRESWALYGVIIFSTLFQYAFSGLPVFIGPFSETTTWTSFLSDFGSQQGISLFLLLLSIIGWLSLWKKWYRYWFLLLILVSIGYLLSPAASFPLALIVSVFAAAGFLRLFTQRWTQTHLRNLTFLLFLLGLLFSSLTYLDRLSLLDPAQGDTDAFAWIKNNADEEAIIFSAPSHSYYVRYFSGREAAYYPHDGPSLRQNASLSILKALYVQDLFPFLEQHNISILFIPASLRAELPSGQGLLFLLKNERFKLVYSSEGAEVWVFKQE